MGRGIDARKVHAGWAVSLPECVRRLNFTGTRKVPFVPRAEIPATHRSASGWPVEPVEIDIIHWQQALDAALPDTHSHDSGGETFKARHDGVTFAYARVYGRCFVCGDGGQLTHAEICGHVSRSAAYRDPAGDEAPVYQGLCEPEETPWGHAYPSSDGYGR